MLKKFWQWLKSWFIRKDKEVPSQFSVYSEASQKDSETPNFAGRKWHVQYFIFQASGSSIMKAKEKLRKKYTWRFFYKPRFSEISVIGMF